MARGLPWYGTCTIFTPARRLKSSIAKCEIVPLPDEEWLSLPGLSFAYLTNSATLLTGSEGCETRTMGMSRIRATGSKSFSVSYPTLL